MPLRAVIADICQKMADYGITLDELQGPVRKRKGGGGSGAKPGRTGRQENGEAEKGREAQEKAGAKREAFLIKRK